VLYKLGTTQTAATFDTEEAAVEFRDAVNSIGAERAMRGWGIGTTARAQRPKGPTVEEWIRTYIDSRTGVTKATLFDYNAYLKHDIAPELGKIPLVALTAADCQQWVQVMAAKKLSGKESTLSGKTLANRHGFLSAALNAAVRAEMIPSNPTIGTRLPRTEKQEMCFLTPDEFDLLKQGFQERWWPFLSFMVVAGTRFGETTALKPSDVNRAANTVYVGRAWKRTYDAKRYEIGVPKTRRSIRTISVPRKVLDQLDYSHEWLFVNTANNPIRASEWRNNVWYPSVAKAKAAGLTKSPRIHDLRHTAASWMVQQGRPLPVVQAHLGHESINTTISLYTHLDRANADEAAEGLGEWLR